MFFQTMLRILKAGFCLEYSLFNIAKEIICLRVSTGSSFTFDIIRDARMLAIVCIEWSVFGTILVGVVDSKLKYWQHVIPVIHLRREIMTQHVLLDSVHSFSLTVSLGVVGSGLCMPCGNDVAQAFGESVGEFCSPICSDLE